MLFVLALIIGFFLLSRVAALVPKAVDATYNFLPTPTPLAKTQLILVVLSVTSSILIITIIWTIITRGYIPILMAAGIFVSVGVLGAIRAFVTNNIPKPLQISAYLTIIFVVCVGASFALGYTAGRTYLTVVAPRHLIRLSDSATITGNIIRSGERGILLYNPTDRKVIFETWQRINALEESR